MACILCKSGIDRSHLLELRDIPFYYGVQNQTIELILAKHSLNALLTTCPTCGLTQQVGYEKNNDIGSNHEFAITDTLTHAEGAVIVAALEIVGIDDKLKVLAFAIDKSIEGQVYSPCGNCRDAIAEYCHEDLVVVSGPANGGTITVVSGQEFFFNDYQYFIGNPNEAAVSAAFAASQRAYADKEVYGATIVTPNKIYAGSFLGDAAYHPALPVFASIVNLRDSEYNPAKTLVQELVIVGQDAPPRVLYKDRQYFLEFSAAVNAFNHETEPIPVKLYQTDADGNVLMAWQTNSYEWLPYSFDPANLGMDMAAGIAKLV